MKYKEGQKENKMPSLGELSAQEIHLFLAHTVEHLKKVLEKGAIVKSDIPTDILDGASNFCKSALGRKGDFSNGHVLDLMSALEKTNIGISNKSMKGLKDGFSLLISLSEQKEDKRPVKISKNKEYALSITIRVFQFIQNEAWKEIESARNHDDE